VSEARQASEQVKALEAQLAREQADKEEVLRAHADTTTQLDNANTSLETLKTSLADSIHREEALQESQAASDNQVSELIYRIAAVEDKKASNKERRKAT
jgi:chromosome segregation ATPase